MTEIDVRQDKLSNTNNTVTFDLEFRVNEKKGLFGVNITVDDQIQKLDLGDKQRAYNMIADDVIAHAPQFAGMTRKGNARRLFEVIE